MIEISIIIPVRNQKQMLSIALTSLRNQIKGPRNFEIVICDDGSTDGTAEMIRQLRFPIFFKYLYNNPPLGRSANRNLGAEKSSGGRLIFFDGDMIPDSGYINAILSDIDPLTVKVGEVKPPTHEKYGPLEKYLYSRGRHNLSDKTQPLPGRLFTSNNFSIDRQLFLRSGGFDTKFIGWGGEDIDYGLRLVALGATIFNEPAAITYHHHKRAVNDLARDFYSFGVNSFEYLITKHPTFLEQLPTHKLGITKSGSEAGIFQGILSRILINSAFLKTAESIAQHSGNFGWPDIVYDYIFWGNLALGYRNRND
jgi:glycosyltransferase involved in cell wall biosynthesis